jgi:hypothetical protein
MGPSAHVASNLDALGWGTTGTTGTTLKRIRCSIPDRTPSQLPSSMEMHSLLLKKPLVGRHESRPERPLFKSEFPRAAFATR